MKSETADSRRPPARSVWTIVGIVAAVLLAIGGLAVLAAIVLVYVGLSQFGSNK
jgi:hypothetical protein